MLQVALLDGVESWLMKLHDAIAKTIYNQLISVMVDVAGGVAPEDWCYKVGIFCFVYRPFQNSTIVSPYGIISVLY